MNLFRSATCAMLYFIASIGNQSFADGYYSYGEFAKFCQSQDNISQSRCNGYIAGIADSAQMMSDGNVGKTQICFRSATVGDIKKVVLDFMRAQRAGADTSAASLVWAAIIRNYSC